MLGKSPFVAVHLDFFKSFRSKIIDTSGGGNRYDFPPKYSYGKELVGIMNRS